MVFVLLSISRAAIGIDRHAGLSVESPGRKGDMRRQFDTRGRFTAERHLRYLVGSA
jgi:hypothetical protein